MIRRPAILFRADAGHRMGFGHVARLAALIEELAALGPHGADPIVMFDGDPELASWLANYGIIANAEQVGRVLPRPAVAPALRLPVNENATTSAARRPVSAPLPTLADAKDLVELGDRALRGMATSTDEWVPTATLRPWTTEEVIAAAVEPHVRAVVIDGPALAEALVPALDARGVRTVVIDDRGDCMLPIDLVINHNHHAPALAAGYPKARRLLLGRKYLMLRRTIRRLGRGACITRRANHLAAGMAGDNDRLRIVVSFGGSDPVGATTRTLQLLPRERPLHVIAIAGPGFRDADALYAAGHAAIAAGHTVEIIEAPDEPGALFVTADAAICSAGGTLGELAYLGCPAFACAIVPDQIAGARIQAYEGLIAGGGVWAELSDDRLRGELRAFLTDDPRRDALAKRALATTDGDGPRRILTDLLG
jgi:spore coat polysaccharide biosynthesis predicted glycosyltransferase SpsG